jgi:hypothetical protein
MRPLGVGPNAEQLSEADPAGNGAIGHLPDEGI